MSDEALKRAKQVALSLAKLNAQAKKTKFNFLASEREAKTVGKPYKAW